MSWRTKLLLLKIENRIISLWPWLSRNCTYLLFCQLHLIQDLTTIQSYQSRMDNRIWNNSPLCQPTIMQSKPYSHLQKHTNTIYGAAHLIRNGTNVSLILNLKQGQIITNCVGNLPLASTMVHSNDGLSTIQTRRASSCDSNSQRHPKQTGIHWYVVFNI